MMESSRLSVGSRRFLVPLGAAALLLAGCSGSSSRVTPPTVRVSPAAFSLPIRADAAVVRRQGYDPTGRVVQTPDGFGQTLYVFHGTCHGSADGYCQIMLFFLGTRYLGTDTANPSTAIVAYRAAGTGTIQVTYATYMKSDPLCCPSGRPVTVTYRWDGRRLIPSGSP